MRTASNNAMCFRPILPLALNLAVGTSTAGLRTVETTFRVLGSAWALRDFDLSLVSQFSEDAPDEVWRVLGQYQKFFVGPDGWSSATGSDRDEIRLSLEASKSEQLFGMLEAMHTETSASRPMLLESRLRTQPERGEAERIPAGLLVAEDIYLRQLAGELSDTDRSEQLELAEVALRSGVSEARKILSASSEGRELLSVHLSAAETLRDVYVHTPRVDATGLSREEKLSRLAESFTAIGDAERAHFVMLMMRRLRAPSSPVSAPSLYVLLDAIAGDPLSACVTSVLEEKALRVVSYHLRASRLSRLPEQRREAMYCLAVDSRSRNKSWKEFVKEASRVYGRSLLVVDKHFDSDVRNEFEGRYMPAATALPKQRLFDFLTHAAAV